MKELYVKDLLKQNCTEKEIVLSGWLSAKRSHKKLIFLNISDSTGTIQAVINKDNISNNEFESANNIPLESAIEIYGKTVIGCNSQNDIFVSRYKVISEATLQLLPQPRSEFDIFNPRHSKQILDYRHIYLRNPRIMAILRFRSMVMKIVREWFENNQFLEFDAPILSPAPLYDDSTAMSINVHGENVYLTQCAGFYLEAAAHAFERVFNMGPSFRGEESRSKRHLMEYWHIKAELVFGNREDIMFLVEDIIQYVIRECQKRCPDILSALGTELCTDGLKTPYPRISYEDAIKHLQANGRNIQFGQSISTADEQKLSMLFKGVPFWVLGIPRSVEPFPYVIDPEDPRITMVADLIASNGQGELLGVAEKICDPVMLEERLTEKGKLDDVRYQFVKDVHQAGCVPHIAFGMGLERLIRWLLNIPHVRDTIPFPRVVRRKIMP